MIAEEHELPTPDFRAAWDAIKVEPGEMTGVVRQ